MREHPGLGGDAAAAGAARGRAAPVKPNLARQELWAELEQLGEARVRELLGLEIYRGGTRFYVEEWLRYREFPRARKALTTRERPTGNATNRFALVAAGTIAAAAFLAHWAMLD